MLVYVTEAEFGEDIFHILMRDNANTIGQDEGDVHGLKWTNKV